MSRREELDFPSPPRQRGSRNASLSPEFPVDLQTDLRAFLALATEALRRDAAERAHQAIRKSIEKRALQLCTWLALLLLYAIALGFLSSATLVHALIDPAAIGRRLAGLGGLVSRANQPLPLALARAYVLAPEEIRSLVGTLIGATILFFLQVMSFRTRTAIGGSAFMGVASLALLALSATVAAGTRATPIALPGFVAVFIVVYQFLRFLEDPAGSVRRTVTGSLSWRRLWNHAVRKVQVIRAELPSVAHRGRTAFFTLVPVLAVLVILAAATADTRGGILYLTSRLSQVAFLAWCAWACVATPASMRVALWSLPVWAAIILTLFFYGPVAVLFALAVLVLLFGNVFLVVLPAWAGTE